MAGVPPLKPRAYYRAVDLVERGRFLIAGRRRHEPQAGVRILCYHRVSADRDVLAVRPDRFRRQLEAIRESGCEPVRVTDAVRGLAAGERTRRICVTFDDGYLDNLEEALPLLEEFEIPATLYVPGSLADGHPDYYWYPGARPPALTPAQLRDLLATGIFDVQSHTMTHPSLPSLPDDRARAEIVESRHRISAAIGRPVEGFSYPAGLYGPREVALAREAGYSHAVTTRAGINTPDRDALELCRTLIGWADDRRRFQAKLDGLLDRPSPLTLMAQRIRALR